MYLTVLMALFGNAMGAIFVLPTIFWHPKNPIFACDTPVLNVRYDDNINFVCPNNEIQPSTTLSKESLSESMYIVPDEQEFKDCQAKDGIRYLRCNQNNTSGQCKHGGIDCPHIYNIWFKEAQSLFETNFIKGGDYYLIATSFRTPERLDDRVGGSCSKTRDNTEFKMRLKIHVCTDQEIQNGQCERCLTEACYYKDCKRTCNPWQLKMEKIFQHKNGQCSYSYHRNCSSSLVAQNEEETKNVPVDCPKPQCEAWTAKKKEIFYSSGKCLQEETRECIDKRNDAKYQEKHLKFITCSKTNCSSWKKELKQSYRLNSECFVPSYRSCLLTWVNMAVKEKKEEKIVCTVAITTLADQISGNQKTGFSTIKYIAIFASLFSLAMGITLGCLCKKHRYYKLRLREEELADMPAQIIHNEALFDTTSKSSTADSPFYIVGTIDRKAAAKSKSSSSNQSNDPLYYPCTIATLPRSNKNKRKVPLTSSTSSQVVLIRPMGNASGNQRYRSESLISMNERYRSESLVSIDERYRAESLVSINERYRAESLVSEFTSQSSSLRSEIFAEEDET